MDVKPKNKIKIVYILPSLDKGGAERFLTDLILNLDHQIYEPILLLFQRGGEWLSELTAENIPVIILEKKYKLDLKNFYQLLSILKKIKPQIVHTQLGGDIYGRLAAKILKVPVILSTEQNVNPDENIVRHIFKKISNGYADKIVAISQAVRKDLIFRYKIKADKIRVIPNGLEISKFLGASGRLANHEKLKNKALTFGTIGRLSPQKGHSILIKAWAKLKTPGLRCLIAGEGDLTDKLTKQIKEAGLEERVKLIGLVSDPAAFLNSLDAFIFPSLWEGQGIVLLEAGLVGRPIIASAVDGILEIIDEETGWLVPAGDETALAVKIDWLADNLDSPLVKERVEKLRSRLIATYDIKKIVTAYQALYQELLKTKITYENTTS